MSSLVQLGFSTTKRWNPVSAVVRWFTKSQVSHAWFLYYDETWKTEMVLEAHEAGFRLLPFEQFQKRNRVVAMFTPQLDIDAGMARVAREFLGRPYDYGGLFGMAFVLFGRLLRRKWRNPWDSSHAAFCSEACVLALLHSGFPQAEALVAHETGPQDLMNFLTEATKKSNGQLVKQEAVA